MQNSSDEIKLKLDVIDILREYIQLKPAGINFRACCPFHNEKTPSFIVSPEKQIWHCFGCGKGGDIFSFVMEMEGLNFVEALRILAPKAGVTLTKQDPKLTSQRNRLLDIIDLSQKYYSKMLTESKEAEGAREYLKERGLRDDTIAEWGIGYSPESWDDLTNLLKAKGFQENEIFLSGMSVKNESSNRFYNRFRGRIMFPINDINGNVVAFTARVRKEKEETEKMGKYINSPQTMIYDKSRILFGLDRAKQEIRKQDLSIVVEGQMDAITAHQNNFKNIIASSGTALTKEQVLLLKRYSDNVSLAFDMDEAGGQAVVRGAREAMGAGMNIKVIQTPEGKDPDEYIKNNSGEWLNVVKNAEPVMKYLLEKLIGDKDLNDPHNQEKIVDSFILIISILGSKIEQDFWINKLFQRIGVKEERLREKLNSKGNSKIKTQPTYIASEGIASRENSSSLSSISKDLISREEKISELLLALILKFPQLVEYTANHVLEEQIIGKDNNSLYRNLLIYYNSIIDNWTQAGGETASPQVDYNGFKEWLSNSQNEIDSAQLKLLDKLVILGDKDFYEHDNELAKNEVIKIKKILKKNSLKNEMKEKQKLILEAEESDNKEKIMILMEDFKNLSDQLKEVE